MNVRKNSAGTGICGRVVSAAAVAVLAVVLSGADSCNQSDPVRVTIFHTNDLHSYFRAPKADEFGLGGFSRLATLMRQRRSAVTHPFVTVDAGDYSEANWYFNIDTGASTLRIMNQMGFDAACIGNHDYIMAPDRLLETVREADVPMAVLAANLDYTNWPHETAFRREIPKSAIIERGGLKFGIIGLTTSEITYAPFLAPLQATDPVESAREEAKRLRPKVDVLLILSHNAFDTNTHIAKAVPGVDAVISGHSHKKVSRAVLVKNAGKDVPVVETGSHARFLGELRLIYDRSGKTVKYDSYELLPVLPSLQEDPEIQAMVDDADRKLREKYGDIDEVVAHSEVQLVNDSTHRPSLGGLLTKAYRAATDSELSLDFQSLAGVTIAKGDVTVRDLHDAAPHVYDHAADQEWTIKLWKARAIDLMTLFTTFYTGGNLLPGSPMSGYLAFDNVEITWRPRSDGSLIPHITEVKIGGAPIDLSRRYEVAITDGVLITLQEIRREVGLQLDLKQMTDTGIEDWAAVVDYGRSVGNLTAHGIREGARGYTVTADPAVFPHSLSLSGPYLDVLVANDGLSRTGSVKLRCSRGKWNDFVDHGTDAEEPYRVFAEASVLPLDPLRERIVRLDWPRGPEQGFIGVSCKLLSDVDGYPGNNEAKTVFKIE